MGGRVGAHTKGQALYLGSLPHQLQLQNKVRTPLEAVKEGGGWLLPLREGVSKREGRPWGWLRGCGFCSSENDHVLPCPQGVTSWAGWWWAPTCTPAAENWSTGMKCLANPRSW